jgi:hypothetical protein
MYRVVCSAHFDTERIMFVVPEAAAVVHDACYFPTIAPSQVQFLYDLGVRAFRVVDR